MVRHNEYSIKFLELTDLLHLLQIQYNLLQITNLLLTLDQTSQLKKRKKEKNVMPKLMKALLPLNPLISYATSFHHNRNCKNFKMLVFF